MLSSLGGAIFRALKGWVIRVCPDGLGGAARGGDGPVVAPTQHHHSLHTFTNASRMTPIAYPDP
jgi:hypothetical protein